MSYCIAAPDGSPLGGDELKSGRATLTTTLFEPSSGGGVYLRHPQLTDFEAWSNLREESRGFLQPWEPTWTDAHLSVQSYRKRMARYKKMVAADEGYPFHILRASDNRLVGACNITQVTRRVAQTASLGYWVGERYARQGFARAAVRAACKFSFETLALHRLEAAVRAENMPSKNLLEALGFHYEGVGRGYLKIDGAWRDHLLYARLSSDRERKAAVL